VGNSRSASRNSFGEAEAERELLVVSRRPDSHCDRLIVDPDLQRLFHGKPIGLTAAGIRKTDVAAAAYTGASTARSPAIARSA
jgi:hypothetical protein